MEDNPIRSTKKRCNWNWRNSTKVVIETASTPLNELSIPVTGSSFRNNGKCNFGSILLDADGIFYYPMLRRETCLGLHSSMDHRWSSLKKEMQPSIFSVAGSSTIRPTAQSMSSCQTNLWKWPTDYAIRFAPWWWRHWKRWQN